MLHPEDLALATACADGDEAAWDRFVREYQPLLRRAARAIDPAGGDELADSLIGELYGVSPQGGERQSLFRYFHGRSKLSTWLRAVLAQRHVDRVRAARRHEPLPDDHEELTAASPAPDPERLRFVAMMRDALAVAIAALPAGDRLRLACYYRQNMKLAAIGRMLGEHEATVSRHLTRTRQEIREKTDEYLRRRHGLDDASIEDCFRSVTEDAGDLDLADLLGAASAAEPLRRAPPEPGRRRDTGPRKPAEPDRSK